MADDNKLRSGYSANAEIVLAEAKHALCIPESALEFEGDKTYVYLIKGEGEEKPTRSVKSPRVSVMA